MKKERHKRRGQAGEGEKRMREWNCQDEGRTEREKKERDFLIEGAIVGLARNLVLGKFPEICKDNYS